VRIHGTPSASHAAGGELPRGGHAVRGIAGHAALNPEEFRVPQPIARARGAPPFAQKPDAVAALADRNSLLEKGAADESQKTSPIARFPQLAI
jgi:hypothetical protein